MATRPKKPFSRMPLLTTAICFAMGIVTGNIYGVGWEIWLSIALVAAIIALVYRKKDAGTIFAAAAFLAAGAFSIQMELNSIRSDRLKLIYDSGMIASASPVEIEGVLVESPEPSMDGDFLTLSSRSLTYKGVSTRVSGKVRLFVPTSRTSERSNDLTSDGPLIERLKYGSRIRVACLLKREDEFLNPGVMLRRDMLDQMGIDAAATIKSEMLIEHIADERVFIPFGWIYDRRAAMIEIFRNNLNPESAGVMIAAILGNKYFLDKGTAELFRDGGTFHVLVISGLHITFIGGIILITVRWFTQNRWIHFAATSSALWLYAIAVGADVPVVRAAFMFTFLLLGYSLYRTGSTFNSIGFCALVLLVLRPSGLFDASFQLTFVSVFAIVGLAFPVIEKLRAIGDWTPSAAEPFPPAVPKLLKRSCETIYWKPDSWPILQNRQIWSANLEKNPFTARLLRFIPRGLMKYLFEGVIVSLAVQISILPLSVIYFHRISFASVFLNLWVGALMAVQGIFVVIGAIIYSVNGWLAGVFFDVSEIANRLLVALPQAIISLDLASIRLPAYEHSGRLIYFGYFLTIIIFILAANLWSPFRLAARELRLKMWIFRSAAALFLVFITLTIFHPFGVAGTNGRLTVHFLDVGQGDAIFLVFPNSQTLLVDGGGRPEYRSREDDDAESADRFEPDRRTIGEAVVSETLWAMGYSGVDHLLPTHADADHIQGLTDVADSFRVKSALIARFPADDADLLKFSDVLDRRRIPIRAISAGDILEIGDVRIEVLYPEAGDGSNQTFDNDHSVVLRIVYGERTFLLTGDIERHAETTLLDRGTTLYADVVKVPHHGSRTSSTSGFVNSVNALLAIIPVGRRSPYGHPHSEVVERWRTSGAEVITTGERGMVTVSTDGEGLWVETFR